MYEVLATSSIHSIIIALVGSGNDSMSLTHIAKSMVICFRFSYCLVRVTRLDSRAPLSKTSRGLYEPHQDLRLDGQDQKMTSA